MNTVHTAAQRWEQLYNQVPLRDVPRHFAGMRQSPFLLEYLTTVLKLCPRGGHTCETGIGSGYGAIWLSLRGVEAEGIDYAPGIVERARQINNMLGGRASFRVGDLFAFYEQGVPPYHVIHHQGVLEHFPVPWIRAALAQQVAMAWRVVFSVPSVYYPFEPEFGDERLLPLEEWERILAPFDVEELRYYGDPQLGGHEHVLCVLRGIGEGYQKTGVMENKAQWARMWVGEEPYKPGISAIVHTRNEARHIAECLQTLQGWTDEAIVCDMESEDQTVEIAQQFTDKILRHPLIPNFDRARNVSAMRAAYAWVFYLDADERVPPGLGPALRELIATRGETFEAALVPFRHYFAGHWMQCLYPGYTAPRLFKNGRFFFNARPHSGAQVDGRTVCFPADDPGLALVHHSFDSVAHHLEKVNRYTDREAANMARDGQPFHWQGAVRHFVHDIQAYYDQGRAPIDGVHGFVYAFQSGYYRFAQHAKLFEQRFRQGQLRPEEQAVPASVEQMLEYALSVVREKPLRQPASIRVDASAVAPAQLVWSGPLYDPSGYGEESRNLLFALDEAGLQVAAQPLPWSHDEVDLTAQERKRLQEFGARPLAPGFIQVVQNFAPAFTRHPQVGIAIGRTMFETDRLPEEWVKACNRMDYIWVPSEFNRQTFAGAGVAADKLVVIPGCLDPAPFEQTLGSSSIIPAALQGQVGRGRFLFLSVFDWTRHKGWDVLLRAFLEAFEGRDDVALVLKVWSTNGYSADAIREQATAFVQREMDHDLLADARVQFVEERLTRERLLALYRACDAFVLPSRGEGWGRPYMEAMGLGLPTIGTNWSGNTAFMTGDNSYLLDYELCAVPEEGWREIPTYRGHRWAEPDHAQLIQLLRRVVEERGEATEVGQRAREYVLSHFSRTDVGRQMAQEVARVEEERRPHPVSVAKPDIEPAEPSVLCALRPTVGGCPAELQEDLRPSAPDMQRSAPISVRWEGAQFAWHSLAHVNREFCLGLLETGQVELSLVSNEPHEFRSDEDPRFGLLESRFFAPLSRPADVHVRHFFPPRLDPPEEGHLVLIQPWEYGYLPSQWIEPILEHVSEVWCYSRSVRDVYLNSGIPADRLQVIPLGVDTDVFTPHAPPYLFTTEPGASRLPPRSPARSKPYRKPFTFLFVGGTLHRKGIDILLDAYLKAFSAFDDVCLVIKDTCTRTVYRGQNERERILSLVEDPTRPPIVYLDDDLAPHPLAGIYTACDCLVQPYRGEGFCLPALEAMACGRPVIVPEGGATDDFVDETVGWRVATQRRPFGGGRIGEWDCAGPTWMLETSPDDLARQMRQVVGERAEVARRGEVAALRVRESWTWRHACEKALQRLEALKETPPPRRSNHIATTVPRPVNSPVELSGDDTSPVAIRSEPTISLGMIVKNEERVLADCLSSVKPWVDEIVVVDTGSTDRTVEIAESFGVKLFHFPWTDSFSEARNVSLEHATGDWLFWMDADDTLPEACGKKLHELARLAEDRVTGFLMQVHIPPAPGETGFTIVDHVKLFRNGLGLRFEGRIHEQILEPIYRQGGRVERSDLYVVHSGYDHSPEGQKRKRERDLLLLEKDLQERPDHPFVWFNIGMTAFHLKDFARAVPALERCLALSKPHESTVRKVYAMLAGCYLEQGNLAAAREWLEKGLHQFPHDPELLFRAGIIYREAGDLSAAEQSYVKLLTAREVGHIDSLDVSMTGFKAHHNLALIYQDMGRMADAEAQWRAAVADSPGFVPSWLGLGELYLRMQRFGDVRAVVSKLAEIGPAQAESLRSRLTALDGGV